MPGADPTFLQVLDRAWRQPFRTRSDFARLHAEAIAQAACRGLITTKEQPNDQWGCVWLITAAGLLIIEDQIQ